MSDRPAGAGVPEEDAPGPALGPLADQIAENVRLFLDGIERLAAGGAGAAAGPRRRGAGGDDPDLDALRVGLARQLPDCDDYAELFDPYADTQATPFQLSDDIAAVAADLIHGLKHYRADRKLEALWWWQYSYFNHWGTHAGAALRALHSVVAHARLDVAEERTVL